MALDINYKKERHTGRTIFTIILTVLLITVGWYGYRWYTTGEIPFSLPLASANTGVSKVDITAAQVGKYNVAASNPRYIRIPSLDVGNARVFAVNLDATNQLAATSNINDVAWYKKSATPGSGGVVLVAGYNGGTSQDGVFSRLKTLQTDSQVVIERGDGKIFTYKVVENQSMSIEEINTTGIKKMGQSVDADTEGLNLITTDGTWIPRLGTFDRRILLRATLIE